jgi:hypothetical protein
MQQQQQHFEEQVFRRPTLMCGKGMTSGMHAKHVKHVLYDLFETKVTGGAAPA